jgi:hypothetical protein
MACIRGATARENGGIFAFLFRVLDWGYTCTRNFVRNIAEFRRRLPVREARDISYFFSTRFDHRFVLYESWKQ